MRRFEQSITVSPMAKEAKKIQKATVRASYPSRIIVLLATKGITNGKWNTDET
ncbi:MAG: hypothetical protein ABSA92_16345 [Candidatus Bathyarchaeia archaeon]